jgi:hypothetical protein
MSTEHIDISTCPKGKDRHRYKLDVERSLVMKFMGFGAGFGAPERLRPVKFTRFFTCPVRNKEFEASFILRDDSGSRIRGVQVAGIANDDDKE